MSAGLPRPDPAPFSGAASAPFPETGGPAPEEAAAGPVPEGAHDLGGLTPAQRGKLLLMLAAGQSHWRSAEQLPALVEAFHAPEPLQEAATAAARGRPGPRRARPGAPRRFFTRCPY